MLKRFIGYGSVILLLLMVGMGVLPKPAFGQSTIEASIDQDNLNTRGGVRWGGGNWPYSKVTEVKDSLVGTVVGRVVLDRHGVDRSYMSGFINSPFTSPEPVKLVFITLWGSNAQGCFAELLFQYATTSGGDIEEITKSIVPKTLEIGINRQIVELPAQPFDKSRRFANNYVWERNNRARSGTWYMTRNLFSIDAPVAKVLSDAPQEEVKARITFQNDETMTFPIGGNTVARWKDSFALNPTCSSSANKK